MDTVQNSAADKLYKKLAALRVTLPNDEREVFDQIIPAEEEVTAHRLAKKQATKGRVTKKASEVTGHRLAKKQATKGRVTKKAPEVTAHRLAKKQATKGRASKKSVTK